MNATSYVDGPVPHGPRAYRMRLRMLGPLAALLPAAVLGAMALVLLRDNSSLARGVAGFVFGVLAAPGLLVAGIPLATGASTYAVAIVGSGVLWMGLGSLAAFRATRSPAASWRDYWREFVGLAAAVWLGLVVALVIGNVILGKALF
jgi:hypothetical protein